MIRKKHYFNTIESKRARFLNAKAKTNIQKIPEWPKKPLSKQRTDLNGNGHHWPAQTIFVKKFLVDPKSRQPPNPKNSVLHKRSTNKSHPTKTGKLPRKDKTTSKTSVQQNYKWPKPNSISTDKRNGPTQIKPPAFRPQKASGQIKLHKKPIIMQNYTQTKTVKKQTSQREKISGQFD